MRIGNNHPGVGSPRLRRLRSILLRFCSASLRWSGGSSSKYPPSRLPLRLRPEILMGFFLGIRITSEVIILLAPRSHWRIELGETEGRESEAFSSEGQ